MTEPSALLRGLDDEQRIAATTVLGPVCILAGAGTGKTRAITHRIAYGVATGAYAPNRVMALTFTSRAAAELRSRLRLLGAAGVTARTFHSAALSQLSYFWPQVIGGQVPRLIDSKARLLGHAAETIKLRADTAALRDLATEVEWRKVSNLTIDQYAAKARTRSLPVGFGVEQIVDLQLAYEKLKDERRQIDFEDVLLANAGMIETEASVAFQVREQYRFFVVDEYQDVSPLQQHLLELWLGDRRDLCVVGDASQTIYSFAGARSDYLLGFASRYDDATVVRLERNYRSTPAIVDTANRLMRGRQGALTLQAVESADAAASAARALTAPAAAPAGPPPLPPEPAGTPSSAPAAPPHVPSALDVPLLEADTDIAEARAVAQSIILELAAGAKAQDVAILYRVNAQAAALETALAEAGVSYQIRGARRFFDLPEVKQAVMQLRAASVSISGEPLFKSVSDVLRSLGWSQSAPEARGAVRDRWESLNAIMSLVDQAPAELTFRQFTDELMERQAAHHEPTVDAVTLATLHSAKGLEWESVYLLGLSEGLVPISYASGFEQIDEERRLFYVGITRARRRLTLSWATRGQAATEGYSANRGRSAERERSRFLTEIGMRTTRAGGTPRG
ncbi:ATP-dependent helicase [Compostimonas suwonensis]|uniref:DNA 3'-5' helicase n=1 Tax=Compostimonas suwonensis TaxID=1048394 RepID=A0A2M9BWI8_9MICO|nr:ATP-dependent helicase [Compostimonas suwonensis]PJJ62285.1 DNA helicase-2/ATP-dependent DNA helicase PcrA [Compostimonas suwonensis]